jgi:hypothetical protein
MLSAEEAPVDAGDKREHQRICKVRAKTNASKSRKKTSTWTQDKKLKALLETADDIQSLEHYTYWKDEFLDAFREYLDPAGTTTVREADDALYAKMQNLAKMVLTVKQLCSSGDISEDGCSVKGQNTLNEFVAEMAKVELEIRAYFPKTHADEDKVGYTKFNLAASLVRDGFRVYGIMLTTRDYIVTLRDGPLQAGDILKVNSKNIMEFYIKSIDQFCDTMADLGMFKLMNKCVELYKIHPRKKKKVFDRKTMDALSDTSDSDTAVSGGRLFCRSKVDFKAIIDDGWTSGVTGGEAGKPSEQSGEEGEDTHVTGKKREQLADPKKPDEWIYYYDPATEKIGKIPRRMCMEDNFIIRRDEDGQEVQDAAVPEWDGEEGKEALIWQLKDALKGKTLKGKTQKPANQQKGKAVKKQ